MKTPDDVAEMLRLTACEWGSGSRGSWAAAMKGYVAAGSVKVFKSPERPKRLDDLDQ
jgi:hypothetical protein